MPTKKRATASTDTAPSRRCQSAPSTMPTGRPGLAQRRTSGEIMRRADGSTVRARIETSATSVRATR